MACEKAIVSTEQRGLCRTDQIVFLVFETLSQAENQFVVISLPLMGLNLSRPSPLPTPSSLVYTGRSHSVRVRRPPELVWYHSCRKSGCSCPSDIIFFWQRSQGKYLRIFNGRRLCPPIIHRRLSYSVY